MTELKLYPGITYTIPDPPFKNKILGFGLPKLDQKWSSVKISLPEEWQDLSKEELECIPEYEIFAVTEDKKCLDGVWFFNKGVPTYISGDHYMYLTWYKLDCGYPQYRDRDRRFFYFWDYCEKDPDCVGVAYGKHRRDGFTYRALSIILNRARRTMNSNYGMVSKTGQDSKDCFDKLIYAFGEFPYFFQPQVQSVKDAKKSLVFKAPTQRITHKNKEIKKEISLNTVVDWRNTSSNAYDGSKQKIILADECGKWREADAEQWFNVGKTCVSVGGGKIFFGSTVNESDSGGKAFQSIWRQSDPEKRVSNNQTVSGLFRYFVPAYDGLEKNGITFIDEYGESVIESPDVPVIGLDGKLIKVGSKPYLENERKAKRDAGDLVGMYEHMRQYPFSEQDMFRTPSSEENVFDLDKIHEQQEHNMAIFQQTPGLLVWGDFMWQGGVRDTVVEWHPNPKGHWLVYWLPPQDQRNKNSLIYNQRSPSNSHVGLFSLDPYDSNKTIDNRRSDAASHGFRKLDFMDSGMSNIFISEYIGRPGDPFVVFEHMILQCVFYGWPILIERQKNACLNYMKQRGYGNYIMHTPDHLVAESSRGKDVDAGMSNASPAVRQSLIENLQHYVFNNVGTNPTTGKMGNMMFDRTLSDWAKFEPSDWGKFDATVSAMLVVAGSKSYTKPPEKSKLKPTDFFKTYSTNKR